MISSSRTHEDQIRKVTQNLNAPFQIRKAESGRYDRSITGRTQSTESQPAGSHPVRQQEFLDTDQERDDAVPDDDQELLDSDPLSRPMASQRQCIRCSARIPAMDFLYTKKTGLCIPCWEEQEI